MRSNGKLGYVGGRTMVIVTMSGIFVDRSMAVE